MDFTATFFTRHSLLNVLTRFCVFTDEKELLVMRPYQIAATEKILQRILIATYDKKKLGTLAAGGYIWHTTGSGKKSRNLRTSSPRNGSNPKRPADLSRLLSGMVPSARTGQM